MSVLKLRRANLLDVRVLFDLRNHPKIREQSINTSKISLDQHKKWFNKVMLDGSKKILIAEKGESFIGMIRFEKTNDSHLISWAISSEFQGQGLGKELVGNAVKRMNEDSLIAKIKKKNIASIKIAEHIGMKLTKEAKGMLFYQK